MECEPGAALSGPAEHGNVDHRGRWEEEVQAWPGSSSWPPNEPVECQLVGFRETEDPGLVSFVRVQPHSLFGTAAVPGEKSLSGEGEVRHLIQRSVSLPHKCPPPPEVEAICCVGLPPRRHPLCGRPTESRLR